MKKIIVCLAVIACAGVGAFAEEKKCDKNKKDCAGKEQAACCSKSKQGGKSSCHGEAPSKKEVLTSPKASTK